MCADGYILRSFGEEATEIQFEARSTIDVGPAALTDEERELRRYRLTDLLDDLRGTSDSVDIVFIASQLLGMTEELALLSERRWTGAGKWLARHLENGPDEFASRLADAFRLLIATDDKQPMIEVASAILDLAGGPLTEGFGGHRPTD